MSMSQEEIESLMNGLDFADDEAAEETPAVEETSSNDNMSEDDINELIAQTEDIAPSNEVADEASVDELLNSIEEAGVEDTSDDDTSVDDILKELESVEAPAVSEEDLSIPDDIMEPIEQAVEEPVVEEVSNDNIDELLASIDGIEDTPVEDTPVEEIPQAVSEPEPVQEEIPEPVIEEISQPIIDHSSDNDPDVEDIDQKINSGVFPLPVEQDTKVVNQLSQVANDSEEKATKIFDVLSNILDYNNDIQNDVQELTKFNEKQIAMLTSLNQKFPNIEAFSQNLDQAQKMGDFISDINDKLNNGNMEIFQAMELMQYHDINRQKIERVMSVIRKLSNYLNNLFEDEGSHKEVAVAKHIHGDTGTGDLVGDDDLEALIAEFNN